MSDTPRTDANTFASPYTSVAGEVTSYEMVDANFCREMEHDLATATQRTAELESRVKQLEGAARGADEAFAKLFWTTDDGINARDGDPEDCDADAFTLARWKACRDVLSPSPPAVVSDIAGHTIFEMTVDLEKEEVVEPPAVERVIICPECYQPCTQDHNSFKCDFCQKLWPKGHGHETYELPDDAPPVQTEEKPADESMCPSCQWTTKWSAEEASSPANVSDAMDCPDPWHLQPEEKPVQTEEKPSVDAYISQLYTDWCECSPYGEQVPDEWPELMAEFVKEHAGKDRDHMAELIMEASSDDSFEKLLLSIFRTSCQFVINDLSNAVYDHDQRKLALIGLDERKTEEKPATVPLAVAEKLLQELQNIADAKPSTWGDMQDQFRPWAQNRARAAITAFQASTKE